MLIKNFMIKKIIFDLDDTLLNTGIIYDKQIDEFIISIINDLSLKNISPDEIRTIQEDIDIKQIDKYGFSKTRFPLSFVETYKFFCIKSKMVFDEKLAEKYRSIGAKVFEIIPELCSGAVEVVQKLSDKYELVIYTLGEYALQKEKIEKNNLEKYFSEYFIVNNKTVDILRNVCAPLPPDECAIVGDSLKGEIAPGVKLGLKSFYIDRQSKWKYQFTPVDNGFIKIKNLKELLNYF